MRPPTATATLLTEEPRTARSIVINLDWLQVPGLAYVQGTHRVDTQAGLPVAHRKLGGRALPPATMDP